MAGDAQNPPKASIKRLRFEIPEGTRNDFNEQYMDMSRRDLENIRSLRQTKRKQIELDRWEAEPENDSLDTSGQSFFQSTLGDSPIIEPFNMASDMKYGKFDADGYFQFSRKKKHSNGLDSDEDDDEEVTDAWLESLKAGVNAPEPSGPQDAPRIHRAEEPSAGALAEEALEERDSRNLLMSLASYLESTDETPAAALRRCKSKAADVNVLTDAGGSKGEMSSSQSSLTEKPSTPASRKRSKLQSSKMDPETKRIFESITEHCNVLMLSRGYHDILSMRREAILREAGNLEKTTPLAAASAKQPADIESTSRSEMFWQLRYRRQVPPGKEGSETVSGPHTREQLHTWIQQQYISHETPADVREVTASGTPVDGVWYSWDSIDFQLDDVVRPEHPAKVSYSSSDDSDSVASEEEPDFGT